MNSRMVMGFTHFETVLSVLAPDLLLVHSVYQLFDNVHTHVGHDKTEMVKIM